MGRFVWKGTLIIRIVAQDLTPLGALPGKCSCEPHLAHYLQLGLSFPLCKIRVTTLNLFTSLCGVLKRTVQRYKSER